MRWVVPVPRTSECADAVVVLPGIMGSELIDTATGVPLWGLADARWYWRAWTSGSSLQALHVTDDERSGRTGRVAATRLLRFPAVAPLLRGIEPYTALVEGIRRDVINADAVLPFPYDWRLSVAHNAQRLAEAADDHLRRWRTHPRGSRSAKLVLIAHSMGGLVARYFTGCLGGSNEVRVTVTMGTPFAGSAKAVQILHSGKGTPVPLPHQRLRQLAATMPGLHDLLPSYRCVVDGDRARAITPADVAAIGGDGDLAAAAAGLYRQLSTADSSPLRSVVGLWQPTVQSLALEGEVLTPQHWSYPAAGDADVVDRGGDGTVFRDAAGGGAEPLYIAQTHGALARTQEVIDHVRGVLTEQPRGAWLGTPAPLSVQLPDVAEAGEAVTITVTGTPDTAGISCRITDAETGHIVVHPLMTATRDGLRTSITMPTPGMYRVAVKGEAFSPITQLLLVVPRTDPAAR